MLALTHAHTGADTRTHATSIIATFDVHTAVVVQGTSSSYVSATVPVGLTSFVW